MSDKKARKKSNKKVVEEVVEKVEDIKKATVNLEQVTDTLSLLKYFLITKDPKIEGSLIDKIDVSLKLIRDMEHATVDVKPIVEDIKDAIDHSIITIGEANEVNITAAKKVNRKKIVRDPNAPKKTSEWHKYVVELRKKPKYAAMKYTDFLKVASPKYKKRNDYIRMGFD